MIGNVFIAINFTIFVIYAIVLRDDTNLCANTKGLCLEWISDQKAVTETCKYQAIYLTIKMYTILKFCV